MDSGMDAEIIHRKIKSLAALETTVAGWKTSGQTVVHCHGVFDLLHPGHIAHFEAARRQGDRLIVTLAPDRFVNKGPSRPVFDEDLRAHTLASMEVIDAVAINEWPTAVETIKKLRPDVYVKGKDYEDVSDDVTGKIAGEREAVEQNGGRLHITREITFSSSNLINSRLSSYPRETEDWLSVFRNKYSERKILDSFTKIEGLRILVVGEAILDEYVFCEGLGKSSKDPILAFHDRGLERYAGGSTAVANHLSTFCKEITFVSVVGDLSEDQDFIRGALGDNVTPIFIERASAPTITKRRFVDTHTKAKLIEIYEMADDVIPQETEAELLSVLRDEITDHDLVVVVDYGHGMMTDSVIKKVCEKAPFLAVNTQHNAGNRGFNTIARYPKADYACMNGYESAIESRLRNVPTQDQIAQLKGSVNCSKITVTLGSEGSMHFYNEGESITAPALAFRVVDRVGAGDAVLALTAPLVYAGVHWEIVAFVTNVVGAEVVGNLGTGDHLQRSGLQNHIRSLLK